MSVTYSKYPDPPEWDGRLLQLQPMVEELHGALKGVNELCNELYKKNEELRGRPSVGFSDIVETYIGDVGGGIETALEEIGHLYAQSDEAIEAYDKNADD